MSLPRLHVVTSDAVLDAADFADRAAALLTAHGPRLALHLRGHATGAAALLRLATALAERARESGSLLLINDRVDLALALGTGAQLGRRSIPVADGRMLLGQGATLGYSAHAADEAAAAGSAGADFVVLGTIWTTPSHPEVEPAGVGLVAETAARAGTPLVAIGGVTPERTREALEAGAYGVAVVSGVWSAPDPVAAAGRYIEELSGVRR